MEHQLMLWLIDEVFNKNGAEMLSSRPRFREFISQA